MKKSLFFFVLTALVITTLVLAQKQTMSIEDRWKKVKTYSEQQLPESALKEIEIIIKQAQKENNTQDFIKALINKMIFTLEINPDEAPKLIKEFENFTENCTDNVERALLHSLTAEMYTMYYQKDQWTINNRTIVNGLIPYDINEWTKNIFFDKINKHLAASLYNASQLQKTDVLKFAKLLDKGEDSKIIEPTLFDFLAKRRINILQQLSSATNTKNPLNDPNLFSTSTIFSSLPLDTAYKNSVENSILDTYQQLLSFRNKDANAIALLHIDLQRIKYLKNNSETKNSDSVYLKALERLETQFTNNEAVIEVLAEKANYFLSQNDDKEQLNKKQAYDICNAGIKQYPNYKRIALLKNIQHTIEQKFISAKLNNLSKPNSNLKVEIQSSNIPKLKLSVYKVDATAKEYFIYSQNSRNGNTLYKKNKLIETKVIDIKSDSNFGTISTETEIKTADYGIYEICIEANGNKNESERVIETFTVTDFAILNRTNVPNISSIYVLDRMSGNPVSNVKMSVYDNKWSGNKYNLTPISNVRSDKNGYCFIPFDYNNNNILFLEKGNDTYFSSNSHSYFNDYQESTNKEVRIDIFTDRSLYRPGQIIYFKAIAYISNKTTQMTMAAAGYEATLYDRNGQKISSKKFKTNEFGSLSGEFILPEGGLNGEYRLQIGQESHTIFVEEYKRPTFEVLIPKPKTEVNFGEKVTITGTVKAYAGYTIADSKVKYRVVRKTHRYCWWWNKPDKEITNGTTTSKADGTFEVSFVPEKTKTETSTFRNEQFYTYTVYADATDPKGETQQGEQYISVGDKSLFIVAEIADKVDKKQPLNIEVSAQTLNGEDVKSQVNYSLYRLENNDVYAENLKNETTLKEAEKVLSGSFDTKNKTLKLDLNKLVSARYKLVFTTPDKNGKEVKLEKTFVVYSTNDKHPAVKSYTWLMVQKNECEVGEKAIVQFGTSTTNSSVLYEVMQGNTVLESKWLNYSNEIKTFEIPFKENYGAGVNVIFSFIKDEKIFTKTVQISRKTIERKLTPTLSVFRNKLLSGEKAEWTVTVPESAKNNKQAELMVGMYDASLDAIRSHNWYFDPSYRPYVKESPEWNGIGFGTNNGYTQIYNKFEEINYFSFNQFDWYGLNFIGSINILVSDVLNSQEEAVVVGYGVQKRSAKVGSPPELKSSIKFTAPVIAKDEEVSEIEKPQEPIKVRTNFNETAFFYPQLRTDANGAVKFAFTAPESLTRWNFNMLAHTKDLYFGKGSEQVITQKDLMVQMNLPRFVRRSDQLVLSANVINLTDKALSTDVEFELIDPATEKPIFLKESSSKKIKLDANQTKAVEWKVTEFSAYELVTCKVVARAGNFSDGEQKYLPVLPDKIMVTESLPLTIRGNQTRTFNFESLLKNGSKVDTKSLTVEFSSNPTWYAIQALPTLAMPETENAIDYFTAYYSNTLATYIANSNPKISAIYNRWKNAGGSREALLSNLQKNTELKNMLLEETPWVMAAKDETEQKRQIALLFDLNMQKNQAKQYMDKLTSLQLPSGAFSWYKGMTESRYITQQIVHNLARLNRLTNSKNNQITTINSALTYLDLEIAHDFVNLKKYNKNYEKDMCIDDMQVFYLLMRSEYPQVPIHVSAQEAVKFYTDQSEKYWTSFSLYGKAMIAVVANRNGKIQKANSILKSLKENAIKSDEFGMYWAKNTASYYWNERPIAVQASIIEAFTEISKDQTEIDEMRIWLLKQKQTQRWDSPSSTVDAIYALVLNGSDWLSNDTQAIISLGNIQLKPQSTEAGTGYFKEIIPSSNVRNEMGKITVSTSLNTNTQSSTSIKNSSIGWGAIYWQYYQDLDKVEGQGEQLKISKKLFVEKIGSTGKTMLPIEQCKVMKGDKIITRLVISTDRNLEFVALKDLRASCFEPVNQRSGCEWKENLCYYQTTKDASTQFYFSFLPKGTYVFEYELWANNSGEFTSGIASIQCQYAPEFNSHTGGERIKVN